MFSHSASGTYFPSTSLERVFDPAGPETSNGGLESDDLYTPPPPPPESGSYAFADQEQRSNTRGRSRERQRDRESALSVSTNASSLRRRLPKDFIAPYSKSYANRLKQVHERRAAQSAERERDPLESRARERDFYVPGPDLSARHASQRSFGYVPTRPRSRSRNGDYDSEYDSTASLSQRERGRSRSRSFSSRSHSQGSSVSRSLSRSQSRGRADFEKEIEKARNRAAEEQQRAALLHEKAQVYRNYLRGHTTTAGSSESSRTSHHTHNSYSANNTNSREQSRSRSRSRSRSKESTARRPWVPSGDGPKHAQSTHTNVNTAALDRLAQQKVWTRTPWPGFVKDVHDTYSQTPSHTHSHTQSYHDDSDATSMNTTKQRRSYKYQDSTPRLGVERTAAAALPIPLPAERGPDRERRSERDLDSFLHRERDRGDAHSLTRTRSHSHTRESAAQHTHDAVTPAEEAERATRASRRTMLNRVSQHLALTIRLVHTIAPPSNTANNDDGLQTPRQYTQSARTQNTQHSHGDNQPRTESRYGILVVRRGLSKAALINEIERQFDVYGQISDLSIASKSGYSSALHVTSLSLNTIAEYPLIDDESDVIVYLGGALYDEKERLHSLHAFLLPSESHDALSQRDTAGVNNNNGGKNSGKNSGLEKGDDLLFYNYIENNIRAFDDYAHRESAFAAHPRSLSQSRTQSPARVNLLSQFPQTPNRAENDHNNNHNDNNEDVNGNNDNTNNNADIPSSAAVSGYNNNNTYGSSNKGIALAAGEGLGGRGSFSLSRGSLGVSAQLNSQSLKTALSPGLSLTPSQTPTANSLRDAQRDQHGRTTSDRERRRFFPSPELSPVVSHTPTETHTDTQEDHTARTELERNVHTPAHEEPLLRSALDLQSMSTESDALTQPHTQSNKQPLSHTPAEAHTELERERVFNRPPTPNYRLPIPHNDGTQHRPRTRERGRQLELTLQTLSLDSRSPLTPQNADAFNADSRTPSSQLDLPQSQSQRTKDTQQSAAVQRLEAMYERVRSRARSKDFTHNTYTQPPVSSASSYTSSQAHTQQTRSRSRSRSPTITSASHNAETHSQSPLLTQSTSDAVERHTERLRAYREAQTDVETEREQVRARETHMPTIFTRRPSSHSQAHSHTDSHSHSQPPMQSHTQTNTRRGYAPPSIPPHLVSVLRGSPQKSPPPHSSPPHTQHNSGVQRSPFREKGRERLTVSELTSDVGLRPSPYRHDNGFSLYDNNMSSVPHTHAIAGSTPLETALTPDTNLSKTPIPSQTQSVTSKPVHEVFLSLNSLLQSI